MDDFMSSIEYGRLCLVDGELNHSTGMDESMEVEIFVMRVDPHDFLN